MVFVEFRLMMYDILWCVNWLLVNVVVNMLNIIVVCVLIIELRLIVINVVIDDVECGRQCEQLVMYGLNVICYDVDSDIVSRKFVSEKCWFVSSVLMLWFVNNCVNMQMNVMMLIMFVIWLMKWIV